MIFGYIILATALLLSITAAYYSVAGLTAIFAAATIPVIIMGGSLELGKIVATVWLHNNWQRVNWLFKTYLIPAIVFLMILTSMGIFGYLSKAHLDQAIPSGDAQTKVTIYDEKIRTAKDNIESYRKALKQMDESVDQTMARTTDDTGANRATNLRRSQQKERGQLQSDIIKNQQEVARLNEERAPLAAAFRKIEAEVGPIKYIAALIYGDGTSQDILEKAVRFVIIMIVLVFDPLALCLILAANKQFEWALKGTGGWVHDEKTTEDKKDKISNWINRIREYAQRLHLQKSTESPITTTSESPRTDFEGIRVSGADWVQTGPTFPVTTITEPEQIATPVEPPEKELKKTVLSNLESMWSAIKQQKTKEKLPVDQPIITVDENENVLTTKAERDKQAERDWKANNQDSTLKHHRKLFETGVIDQLPWIPSLESTVADQVRLEADNVESTPVGRVLGFGSHYPLDAVKGDMFLRVDRLPSALYKYNGSIWIEVDKNLSDTYVYDDAYIDHLITKIDSGEYDPELLSDAERDRIEQKLKLDPPLA